MPKDACIKMGGVWEEKEEISNKNRIVEVITREPGEVQVRSWNIVKQEAFGQIGRFSEEEFKKKFRFLGMKFPKLLPNRAILKRKKSEDSHSPCVIIRKVFRSSERACYQAWDPENNKVPSGGQQNTLSLTAKLFREWEFLKELPEEAK